MVSNVLSKYNNFAHSTTWPGDSLQIVDAQCNIEECRTTGARRWARSNLTPVYRNALDSLVRRVSLKGRSARVEDYVKAGADGTTMNWNMTTEAVSAVRHGRRIILTSADGSTLRMKVRCSSKFDMTFGPFVQNNDYENPAEGTSRLRLSYSVPAAAEGYIKVDMKP